MKKINMKKVLSFLVVSILVLIKIFCYLDTKTTNFSIDYYEGAKNVISFLLVFAILYVLYGIYDLFKNSLIVGLLDFLTGISIVVLKYTFDNDIFSNILLIVSIFICVLNLIISFKIKSKNEKTQRFNERANKSGILPELLLTIIIFIIIVCITSIPMYNSSKGIELNAEKLAKNISLFETDGDLYILAESNPDTGDIHNAVLNSEYEIVREYNEDENTISFAKLYKNNKYYLVGIIKNEILNKYYLINSKMDEICELEKVGNPNYLEEYLLDVLNYAIDNKLINYEKADTEVYTADPQQNAVLYLENDYYDSKYETDSNYKYKYYENEKNPNYLIQVEYDLNMIDKVDSNVMEQLFGMIYTNIDNDESLYNVERNYYLINNETKERYKLNCDNLLYDQYAKLTDAVEDENKYLSGFYSFSDGKIPYYDEYEYGFFDLSGNKHIDNENTITIDTYENYNIVYDMEQSKYFMYSNLDLENPIKEYENIYTFNDYIIGLNNEVYEILNPNDLAVLKEITMKGYDTEENENDELDEIDDDANGSESSEEFEDTENTENIEETEELIDEEDIEDTEYVEDNTDNVTVYNNGELILLKNNLTYLNILLHYDSDKKTIEVLNEDVIEFQSINKTKCSSNNFYLY